MEAKLIGRDLDDGFHEFEYVPNDGPAAGVLTIVYVATTVLESGEFGTPSFEYQSRYLQPGDYITRVPPAALPDQPEPYALFGLVSKNAVGLDATVLDYVVDFVEEQDCPCAWSFPILTEVQVASIENLVESYFSDASRKRASDPYEIERIGKDFNELLHTVIAPIYVNKSVVAQAYSDVNSYFQGLTRKRDVQDQEACWNCILAVYLTLLSSGTAALLVFSVWKFGDGGQQRRGITIMAEGIANSVRQLFRRGAVQGAKDIAKELGQLSVPAMGIGAAMTGFALFVCQTVLRHKDCG
ncbi:hypothetical protein HJC06_01200 [Rhizobium sp. NLR9b]|uniref:hypothetical protein n=1 Tax=unclassified Rhizobium TaxID=2613769 RepID=UPI001C83A036|nr:MULTISPECIES: hypothetical protein [unclassified Rhizobium]MBX5225066.1 hypothetical protein [Rhizobium sp. NLR9b]MBX5285738.1 hypothetical protein [Rhizobium sp. NLR10b]